jgi:putative membrane protein
MTWNADPAVVTGVVLLGGGYALATARRRHLDPAATVEPARVAAFVGALGVLLGALTGPLHDLSDHYLFSAHMVQHLLLAFAMPPLLLHGTPGWMVRPLLRSAPVRRLGRRLTRPTGAFAAFNLVLVAWHLPPLYNLAMAQHPIHVAQHLMIMAASVILWWPVLSQVTELPRAPFPVQLLFLFVVGLPMVAVSIFITMAQSVLYPYYAAAPRVFDRLPPLADQHVGGLIMWIPGSLVFLVAISIVFFRWQLAEGDGPGSPALGATHGG